MGLKWASLALLLLSAAATGTGTGRPTATAATGTQTGHPTATAATGTQTGHPTASAAPGAGTVRPSASSPPGDAQQGAAIAPLCESCHGTEGMKAGNPPVEVPRLKHQRATFIFYALEDYRSGRRKSDVMQPLAATLDEQKMRDVAVYLSANALGPPHPAMESSSEHALATRECSLCHGETGMGEMEGMPILTGQKKGYLLRALSDYRKGLRSDPTMTAVARRLTSKQTDALATYYSAQQGLEDSRPNGRTSPGEPHGAPVATTPAPPIGPTPPIRPESNTPALNTPALDTPALDTPGAKTPPATTESGPTLPHMLDIPAGHFDMGAAPGDDTQQGVPRHPVTLRAFKLSETDVTFDQYDRFARSTHRPLPQDEGFGRGTRPVINIDRADMLAYLGWLGRTTGEKGFRLPTEAEWEYAARAGTTTAYYWGNTPDPHYANTAGNKEPDHFPNTSPVKSFLPNPHGLYDMAGNVWQEVEDCAHPDYHGAPSDGRAWTEKSCVSYITRGGCYGSITRGIKTTARAAVGASFRSMSVCFRVSQDASP